MTSSNVECLGLLRTMRMLLVGVDLQLLDHGVSERAFRQHPTHRERQRASRKALLHLAEVRFVYPARVSAVAVVLLVLELRTGDLQFRGVDDDDVVAGVHVRRVLGLVLASKAKRNLTAQPPQDLVLGVDQQPIAPNVLRLGGKCFHHDPDLRSQTARIRRPTAAQALWLKLPWAKQAAADRPLQRTPTNAESLKF